MEVWILFNMSLSGGQLAGGNSVSEKAENDYYATDPKTVELFLNTFDEIKDFKGSIWEPSCGGGNIAEAMRKHFPQNELIATDLVYRNYGKRERVLIFSKQI